LGVGVRGVTFRMKNAGDSKAWKKKESVQSLLVNGNNDTTKGEWDFQYWRARTIEYMLFLSLKNIGSFTKSTCQWGLKGTGTQDRIQTFG
jgi:hypothetical protein